MPRPWQILHTHPRPAPATDAPYHAIAAVEDHVQPLMRVSTLRLEPSEYIEEWRPLRGNAQRLALAIAVDMAAPLIQELAPRPAHLLRVWTGLMMAYPDPRHKQRWKASLRERIATDAGYYLGEGHLRDWQTFPVAVQQALMVGLQRAMQSDRDIGAVCYLIAALSRAVDPAPPVLNGLPDCHWFPDRESLRIQAFSYPDVPRGDIEALWAERTVRANTWFGIWWQTVKDALAVAWRPHLR